MTSPVLVRVDKRGAAGHVATVSIHNAARVNSLSTEIIRAFIDTVTALGGDPDLRALIVTGEGEKAFMGGANLFELADLDPAKARVFLTDIHHMSKVLRDLPVPVIARVNGWCLGAGLEVMAACDMRAAADTARFGMPEVLFGLPSGMEACLLPQLIGWGKTRELVFTGRHIDCAEAAACGLVERVAPPEGLDQAVEDWVADILRAGPNSIRAQKELIRDWERMSIADAVQQGIRAVAAAHGTEETKRLMGAFLERKRAPG